MPTKAFFEDKPPVRVCNIQVIINDEWTGDTVISTGSRNSYISNKILDGEKIHKIRNKDGNKVDIACVKLTIGKKNVSMSWPMIVVYGEQGCLPELGGRLVTEIEKGIK